MTIHKVDDSLWRGHRPEATDWAQLRKLGIKRIVSLESGFFELSQLKLDSEADICKALGIGFMHYKMNPICPPSYQQIFNAVHFIRTDSDDPTYFHCFHGVDRTGIIAAAYEVYYLGYSIDHAIERMLGHGFHVGRYLWWIPSIVLNLKKLEKERRDGPTSRIRRPT